MKTPRVIVDGDLVFAQRVRYLDAVERDLVARGLYDPEAIPSDMEPGRVFTPGIRTGKWSRLSPENLARLGLPPGACGDLPELLVLVSEGFFET